MKNYFFSNLKKLQYKLFLGDLFLIAVSIFISYSVRIYLDGGNISLAKILERIHPVCSIFFFLHPMILYIMDLYSPPQQVKEVKSFLFLSWSVLIGGALGAAFLFFVPRFLIGRKILLIHLPLLSLFLYGWRRWIFQRHKKKFIPIPLGLVGRKEIISSFIKEPSQ